MFFSCPHCRDLVATDRETNLPPLMCPRCGGTLRKEKSEVVGDAERPAAGLSIASLLQATAPSTSVEEKQADAAQQIQHAPADTNGDPVVAEPDAEATADFHGQAPAAANGNEANAAVTAVEEIAAPGSIAQVPGREEADAPQYPGPSFTLQRARPATHARTAKWQWAALVVLAVTLGLQVLLSDRERLAADAVWRPTISFLCGVLGCSVPAWHQPGAFSMLSRDVSPIKDTAGGLNVQATFRNDARWPQAWPVLLLSLSDADGRILGARAFAPSEYLGAAATQTELAPGQSAQITLKLHEPNPDVVAYSFDFR